MLYHKIVQIILLPGKRKTDVEREREREREGERASGEGGSEGGMAGEKENE